MLCVLVFCPGRSEEDAGSPGTGVPDRCASPRGCWELNADPRQEQQVFLTTEPRGKISPAPVIKIFDHYIYNMGSYIIK